MGLSEQKRKEFNELLTIPKPKRGRPRIHPDRKAYRAAWMRDDRKRRAKAKEGE